jgi:hypothetical protein
MIIVENLVKRMPGSRQLGELAVQKLESWHETVGCQRHHTQTGQYICKPLSGVGIKENHGNQKKAEERFDHVFGNRCEQRDCRKNLGQSAAVVRKISQKVLFDSVHLHRLGAMEKFEASLPLLIQRLPPPWRKSGSQDQALNVTVYVSCCAWREETGKWPSATVTPEVGVTAPLYQFLARHCELTPATWSRALAAAKKRRPPWLPAPRKKARKSQSKAPDCD